MFVHHRFAFLLFSALWVAACKHPCQVYPEMCPAVSLTVAAETPTQYPGLIQLKDPHSILKLTIATQSGASIDNVGPLAVSFCPKADICRDDCEGIFTPASLPAAKVADDNFSRTYSLPATLLSGLALGPGKVCITGAAIASGDVYTINRLVAARAPSSSTLKTFDGISYYKPISFDLGKDDQNNSRALVLGESGPNRNVFSYKYASGSFTGAAIDAEATLQIAGGAQNLSLQAVSVFTDTFLLWATEPNPSYTVFQCPLKDGPSSCSGHKTNLDNWTVSTKEKITATAGDTLASPDKRFIVSLAAGPKSLKAYSLPLPVDVLAPVWESNGPAGPVALATATLHSGGSLSDVIAVAKIRLSPTPPDNPDVSVFLASSDRQLTRNELYSQGLRAALFAALGTTRALIALASGDLDGDGLSDIVLLADGNPQQIFILFNLGGGAFRVAGVDLKDPSETQNDEPTLSKLTPQPDAIDIKVANLDPLDPAKVQLVVLAPTTISATDHRPAALLQVIRLQ